MTTAPTMSAPMRDLRQCYLDNAPAPGPAPAPDLVWIPAGSFRMGCNKFYPEERPERQATVSGFWMERTPVTVAQFRRFVEATGYITLAESGPLAENNPGIDATLLRPGGMVFQMTKGPVSLADPKQWWIYKEGANWRRPLGHPIAPGKADDHPVVQIAYHDALAYATWAGRALPSEAEWEFAARGGLDGATFAWGEQETAADGRHLANNWQGRFPYENTRRDGYVHTSPVGAFPANGYGLSDMIGNVWEWTCNPAQSRQCGCGSGSGQQDPAAPMRVLKGGSYLCSPDYCFRYRPAARSFQSPDLSTCHLGFRCIVRPAPAAADTGNPSSKFRASMSWLRRVFG